MNNTNYQDEYKNAIKNLENKVKNREITWYDFNEELETILTIYNKKHDNEFANQGIYNEFDSSDLYKTNLKGISSNPYINKLDKGAKSNLERMISQGNQKDIEKIFNLINVAYETLPTGTYINTPQK